MLYKLRIRNAVETDVAFILQGYRDICAINGSAVKPGYTPEKIRQDLFGAPASAQVLIAEHQEKPVGFTLFSTVYFAGEGRVMWVSQVYVDPAYRKRNVAWELVKALRETADAQGYGGICGATGMENARMQRFMQKAGLKRLDGFMLYSLPLSPSCERM